MIDREKGLKRCVTFVLFVCSALNLASQIAQTPQAVQTANFETTRKSVVFIFLKDKAETEHPDGTGFLLFVPTKSDANAGYIVLVTARHMVDPQWIGCPITGDLLARFNKQHFNPDKEEVGTVDYSLKEQRWIVPDDDSVDIAYTVLDGTRLALLGIENQGIRLRNLPSSDEAKAIGIGTPIVSAGLLENASGIRRNYPIFKFGNISSIPEKKILVPGCNNTKKAMTEWLVAASLVPGNSGSPVVSNPPAFQGQRTFMVGVQSISFIGSDVAGVAPIRYFLESIRHLALKDADFSQPVEPGSAPQATPSSAPTPYPAKPSAFPPSV